jgi:hypothetical protein
MTGYPVRMAGAMVGMRGVLLASVLLVGVGTVASASSSTAATGRPTARAAVADRAVSQIAPPVAAANPAPPAPAPPTTSPAPASPAQPAWRIVPKGSLAASGAPSTGQPFFRGGVHSRVGPPSTAAGIPRVATSSGPVLYNGLKAVGETAALPGNVGGTPPDSTGSIGPNDYVEMVNSSIAVYDRNNLNLRNRATLNNFLGGVGGSYCDVQIQWDPTANRWLFAFLLCNAAPSGQGFYVGWSRTSSPLPLDPSGWCAFGVGTGHFLFDYPKLGHNSNYLIVGGNFYDMSQGSQPFASAGISWLPLPSNSDASCTPTAANISNSGALVDGDGTTLAFTPVPVNTITGATDGFVFAAYDPAGNVISPRPQSRLAAWHLNSAGVLHQDADVPVTTYSAPFSAPDPGGTYPIDTLDGRLTQAVGDPTTGIWTQHTVGGAGGRSEVDWYEITVSGTTPSIAQLGSITNATDFVFNAAISPRFDGQGAAIEYSRSGTATLPTIAAQIRIASTPAGQMEPGELVLATSTQFDHDFSCNFMGSGAPCRWGDYSGATPDPVHTNVVWGTNEFLTTTATINPAWSDENFALLVAIPPQAPTAVTATASDQSARVSWTPSTFDAGDADTSYTITAYVGVTAGPTVIVGAPATAAIFKGLTNGVTYTFTVIATNHVGASPESPHSNAVTPTRAVQQVPIAPPGTRSGVTQTTAPPIGPR